MRTITMIMLLMTMQTSCTQGKGTFNDFYQQNKYNEGVVSFEIPSFIFQYLVGKADLGDEEGKELLGKVRGIQVYISEGATQDDNRALQRSLDGSIYKDLLVMRDGASTVTFKARHGKRGIDEILLTATGDEGLFVLSLSGRFTEEDAQILIHQVNLADAFNMSF